VTAVTKVFTAIIIVFNVAMSVFFFLSSQILLLASDGRPIVNVGIFYVSFLTQRGLAEPYRNVPFFVLLFSLIVNALFVIMLLRSKETKQTPS
jgi:hypothetical protein